MKLDKIIVSDTSHRSVDPYDLPFQYFCSESPEEGLDEENIHEDSVIRYYVDDDFRQYKIKHSDDGKS
ncbi:hypothetical protein [Chryseobacterium arthrosphaerae]|uniref:Uncharacterized protein n=1 Tax=Chryseobacterium arthrosphaerae TaxID=651561 RepID=A0A1B8ZEX5_9FLAO|nr:hypothetical protein [Chryseobacterium arthrosphaerae]OCA70171.1 hypothetical protein BBI00_20245 [Chryseobacterium arthrosphaerae]